MYHYFVITYQIFLVVYKSTDGFIFCHLVTGAGRKPAVYQTDTFQHEMCGFPSYVSIRKWKQEFVLEWI